MNNRLIDIEKLSRYHENLKNVLNTKEAAGEAAKAEAAAKKYADEEIAKLSFDESGAAEAAAAQALQDAKDYADGKFQVAGSYEEAGAAAQALQDAKDYADGKFQVAGSYEEAGAAAQALADAKDYADGKFQEKGSYEVAGAAAQALADAKADAESKYQVKGSYEEAGAAAQALDAAKEYTDDEIAKLSFDEAGTAKSLADAAEQNAKDYADGKFQEKGNYEVAGTAEGFNTAMNERVTALEAIDHEKLAADASSAAVATILDGAPEKFDTLKEVADWISNNESASSAADLVTRVAALEAIDHDAYVDADATNLQAAKDYADGLAGNYDANGAAAQALADAKADAESKYQVKGEYEVAGAAAQALADAKADAESKYQVKGEYLTADDLQFATDDEIDGLFV